MHDKAWQLEVIPIIDRGTACVLEVPEALSLDDLHEAISERFALPLYDGYAFFMNGDMDGEEFQYGPASTAALHSSEDTTIGSLGLKRNKRFLYAFDESEEYALTVRALAKVDASGAEISVLHTKGHPDTLYAHLLEDEDDDDETPEHEHSHIHHGCHHDGAAVSPELAAIGREIAPRFERWVRWELEQRELDSDDEAPAGLPESPGEVRIDADLLERLLELSEGEPLAIHLAVEHGIDAPLWPWALSIPARLSAAGDHARAAELCRRLDAVAPISGTSVRLPLYLARAGRREEALACIEDGLEGYPEDMHALRYAGEALVELGDLERAERLLREALHFAGGHVELRGEILQLLFPLLKRTSKHAEAKALLDAETRRYEEMMARLEDDAEEA